MALSPQEQQELDALQAELGGLNQQEYAELQALQKELGGGQQTTPVSNENPIWSGVKSVGAAGLDLAGRALDYGDGITRVIAANKVDNAKRLLDFIRTGNSQKLDPDKNGAIKLKDLGSALVGKAPDSDEVMTRWGVPEGASVDLMPEMTIPGTKVKIGEGKTSARGFGGFVLDNALSPSNVASFGGASLAKSALKEGAETTSQKLLKLADKVYNKPAEIIGGTGKKIYKSALKRVDLEAAKYGKEPVSDLLMQHRVAGSAGKIQKEMDRLGDQFLSERDDILKQATRAGGEVSMEEAMAPTIARIRQIRLNNDPNLLPLADALEEQVNQYLARGAKESKDVIRELPVSAKWTGDFQEVKSITPPQQVLRELPGPSKVDPYLGHQIPSKPLVVLDEIPGRVEYGGVVKAEPVFQPPLAVIDKTERIAGPSPMTASGYKTTMGAKIPDSARMDQAYVDATNAANKEMQGGMRVAVENSTGRALGNEAKEQLIQKNDALGRILTTRDKQAAEAAKEYLRDGATGVDALVAGSGNGWMLLAKKIWDVAKMAGPRTYAGRAMYDVGANPLLRTAASSAIRQGYREGMEDYSSPWLQLTTAK